MEQNFSHTTILYKNNKILVNVYKLKLAKFMHQLFNHKLPNHMKPYSPKLKEFILMVLDNNISKIIFFLGLTRQQVKKESFIER